MNGGKRLELGGPVLEAPLPVSFVAKNPAMPGSISGFFSFSSPCMHVLAVEGGSVSLPLAQREWISLIIVIRGEVEIHQLDCCLSCSAGDCFFLPEHAALWISSDYNVVCVMISPDRLRQDLKNLSYQGFDWMSTSDWNFSKPVSRKVSDGILDAALLSAIHHLLQLTSELVIAQPSLFTRLGIGKQLCLLTALLGSPDVSRELASDPAEPRQGGVGEAIDDLIVYMQNNLSEPLNLTILEKYSHYSRRALQYAFRQRFGCTITQWLRSHRLDLAYGRFVEAQAGDTVASIAKDCGYRSVSLFSLDFQKRFHTKPSVLLRNHQSKA